MARTDKIQKAYVQHHGGPRQFDHYDAALRFGNNRKTFAKDKVKMRRAEKRADRHNALGEDHGP